MMQIFYTKFVLFASFFNIITPNTKKKYTYIKHLNVLLNP